MANSVRIGNYRCVNRFHDTIDYILFNTDKTKIENFRIVISMV